MHPEFNLDLVSVFVAASKVSSAYLNSFEHHLNSCDLETSQRPSLRHAAAAFQTHKSLTLNITSAAQAHWAALRFYQCLNFSLLSGLFCKVGFLWEPCGPHPAWQGWGFRREGRYCKLHSTSLPAVIKVQLSKAAHVNTNMPRSLELNTWLPT